MSYKVLARKWRPANFKELVGQEAVVRILTNSLKDQKLHPALIFSGPRGTGKTSSARILAKTLNCPHKKDNTPCSECKTCKDIDDSRNLDVLEIDGASNNGIEAVRELKETVSYLPAGPFKIYIIDEVHMLSMSAFNALLKTLEEPPPQVIFIMATTEMRKIPPTVLSRCQILQFRQINDHLIYEQLKKICKQEKAKASDTALWMLARQASGSLRDAEGLLDQMMAFCQEDFSETDVSRLLGLMDHSLLMECLYALLKRNSKEILQLLQKLHTKGTNPAIFLQSLIKELRHLLMLKLLPAKEHSSSTLVPISEKEKSALMSAGQAVSPEQIHLLFDMALKGQKEITHCQDPKTYLEMLILRMSTAPHIETLMGAEPINSEDHFVKEVQHTFSADILNK